MTRAFSLFAIMMIIGIVGFASSVTADQKHFRDEATNVNAMAPGSTSMMKTEKLDTAPAKNEKDGDKEYNGYHYCPCYNCHCRKPGCFGNYPYCFYPCPYTCYRRSYYPCY